MARWIEVEPSDGRGKRYINTDYLQALIRTDSGGCKIVFDDESILEVEEMYMHVKEKING